MHYRLFDTASGLRHRWSERGLTELKHRGATEQRVRRALLGRANGARSDRSADRAYPILRPGQSIDFASVVVDRREMDRSSKRSTMRPLHPVGTTASYGRARAPRRLHRRRPRGRTALSRNPFRSSFRATAYWQRPSDRGLHRPRRNLHQGTSAGVGGCGVEPGRRLLRASSEQ